jgi:hypothetical protein
MVAAGAPGLDCPPCRYKGRNRCPIVHLDGDNGDRGRPIPAAGSGTTDRPFGQSADRLPLIASM